MTISSTTNRNDYTGNGVASSFSYTFRILDETDLLVTTRLIATGVETTLTLMTDYTVSGVGGSSGGSITLVAGALPSTKKITIRRVRPLTQETDIRNQGEYFPETIEDEFDRGIMIDQQIQDQLDRSITLPETVPVSEFNPELPPTIAGASSKTLVTNSSGNGFELGDASTSSPSNPLPPSFGGSGISNSDLATFSRSSFPLAFIFSASTTLILPSSGTLVTTSGAEQLTNKDYDGGTASNTSRMTIPKATLSTLQGLVRKQGTIVYATDRDKAYLDSGSILKEIGSGSEGGGINYLPLNSVAHNFEDNLTTGWAIYANTVAASTPEVSPGGSPNVAFTFATSALSPLRQSYSGVITKDNNNRQGYGIRTNSFNIDSADINKKLTINFDFDATNANYVSGDIGIYISDGTNIISPSVVNLPSGKGSFVAQFVSTSSTTYRLIFHVTTTNASSYSIKIDNIFVGPQTMVVSPAISDYQTYTPTGSWSTNTTYSGRWKRVGDVLQGRVSIGLSGAPTSASLTFTQAQLLPNNWTIDTTKLPLYSTSAASGLVYSWNVGTWNSVDAGSNNYSGTVMYDSSSAIFRVMTSASPTAAVSQSSPFTYGSTDSIDIVFFVPISNWDSQLVITTGREEFAYNTDSSSSDNTSSFGYGANGSIVPNRSVGTQVTKRVRFVTPVQASDIITLEILQGGVSSSGNTWIPWEKVRGSVVYQGSSIYGVSVFSVSGSSTDVDVVFNAQGWRSNNATYAGNGSGFDTLFSNGDLWRLRKSQGTSVAQAYDYEEGTATLNFNQQSGSGGSGTTVNAIFRRIGKQIIWDFPDSRTMTAGASANNQFATSSGSIPSRLRPVSSSVWQVTRIQSNGTISDNAGYLQIDTDGTVKFVKTLSAAGNFTNSSSDNGFTRTSVTYSI